MIHPVDLVEALEEPASKRPRLSGGGGADANGGADAAAVDNGSRGAAVAAVANFAFFLQHRVQNFALGQVATFPQRGMLHLLIAMAFMLAPIAMRPLEPRCYPSAEKYMALVEVLTSALRVKCRI